MHHNEQDSDESGLGVDNMLVVTEAVEEQRPVESVQMLRPGAERWIN